MSPITKAVVLFESLLRASIELEKEIVRAELLRDFYKDEENKLEMLYARQKEFYDLLEEARADICVLYDEKT